MVRANFYIAMTAKQFIDTLVRGDEAGLTFIMNHRVVVVNSALFDEGSVSGWDLLDTTLYDQTPEVDLEDLCILSWREDRPNELKLHWRNLDGTYTDEEVTSIVPDHDQIVLNGKFEIYALTMDGVNILDL